MKYINALKEYFTDDIIDDEYNLIEFLDCREELNERVAIKVSELSEKDFIKAWIEYGYRDIKEIIEELEKEDSKEDIIS